MSKLRDILLYTSDFNDDEFLDERMSFFNSKWSIQEMFLYQLRKVDVKSFFKFNIQLTAIESTEQLEVRTGKIVEVLRYFDFDSYFLLSNFEKKKLLLNIMYEELLKQANKGELKRKLVEDAYNHCLDNDLYFKFRLSNKVFRSPCRSYYGALDCEWDMNTIIITAIIYDTKKVRNELMRKVLYEGKDFGPYIWSSSIYWNKTCFSFEITSPESRKGIWFIEANK